MRCLNSELVLISKDMSDSPNETLFSLLKGTSRSFYLGIMGLQSPQREYICNAYLFCRLMDIFEDATHAPPEARLELIQLLRHFLSKLKLNPDAQEEALSHFLSKSYSRISDFENYFVHHADELKLYSQSEILLREMMKFPLIIRSAISESLMDMALGMEEEIQSPQNYRKSRSLRDFDQYCYTVAGTVGLFLTRIFWDAQSFLPQSQLSQLETLGESFGKALQIVNITKDFHKDWKEGRCFWPQIQPPSGICTNPPDSQTLSKSLEELNQIFIKHFHNAEEFISQLDSKRNDIRFFCAFPLEMAKQNMILATESHTWLENGDSPKISKTETLMLVQKLTFKYALPKLI